MNIENTKPVDESTKPLDTRSLENREAPFEPEIIGVGDMLIKVEKRNEKKEYEIIASIGDGQYKMNVTENQLQKLRDGTYTVTTTPSGVPMLQKLG